MDANLESHVVRLFYLGVDRQIALQRKPAIESVEELVKKLRISGVEESSIQRFIAKYSGSNWEEYFQDIFGYEAMRSVRADASWQAGSKRKRFRPVRDFLIDRMEERLSVARSRRDQKKLQKIEQEALVESGMSEDEAATKADQFSKALVDEAAAWRRAATEYRPHAPIDPVAAAQAKRQRIKAMLADARSGKYRRRPLAERLEGPFDLLLGNHVRLMLGCLLIAGCTLWAQQNGIFDTVSVEKIRDVATTTVDQGGTSVSDAAKQIGISSDQTQPLNWPIVGSWFDSFGSGVAGLILLVTALFRGWRMSLFALPAAVVAWLGPSLGIPPIPGWCDAQITSILAGVGIGIIGILFGRTRY